MKMPLMRQGISVTRFIGLSLLIVIAGCAQPYRATLPPDLRDQITHTLSFSQIKAFPHDHKEQVVLLGGQVLSAKRLPDSTELVILQLPLLSEDEPTTELTHSQGRFIAYQTEFLDPATVPPGTRLTILGQLSGSVTQALDETDYTYPTLTVKDLKVWPTYSYDSNRYRQPYPYWGPWGGYYGHYPFWY